MPRTPLFDDKYTGPPYEVVPLEADGDHPIAAELRDRIFVHTVHDGAIIPREFLYDDDGKMVVDRRRLNAAFIRERDWGANLLARSIATALGLKGFGRCRIARALMDFNRFPGASRADEAKSLDRLAIHPLFADRLAHEKKMDLLERYYDRISDIIEAIPLDNHLVMLAIHTYDEHNPSKTRRSHLSLLSSVATYQRESRMPFGVFDPMYPDVLGESTSSRILRDRVSLILERNGFRVAHNHPYPLPEGSMEVRAQVWFFFKYLRERFEAEHPQTVDDAAYTLVWLMLLNTNLRLQEAEALRSYLHRFRRVQVSQRDRLRKAQLAYVHVRNFLERSTVLRDFRRSKERPSSLGIEVRKDLVCTFDDKTGRPMPLTRAQQARARFIGSLIAEAVAIFFDTDRPIR